MKHLLPFLLLFAACTPVTSPESRFRLHLFQEPLHLDPARTRSSSANYFFYNTQRGLYKINAKGNLTPEGGQCLWQNKTELLCQIEQQMWSNGTDVAALDYKRAIDYLKNPDNASPRAGLVDKVKEVKVLNWKKFTIHFSTPDPEFMYKLASSALYPRPKDQPTKRDDFKKYLANGPYQIDHWNFGKELVLKPNPYYSQGHPKRPPIQFVFLDDEMTSFRLYRNGQLDFVRRVPSKLIAELEKRDDFHQVPMARFDYIGFGPRLQKDPELRKALAKAIDYPQITKILHSLGLVGCSTLPSGWIDKAPCHDFNVAQAKSHLAKVANKSFSPPLQFKVSALGGDDIKKQAEFYQAQWQKNLGVRVEVSQVENKTLINELRTTPPDIFRKGVGLDLPTCLNALQTFAAENSANYIGWSDSEYQKIIQEMATTKKRRRYRDLCAKAMNILVDKAAIIPLGEMHFSLLASPRYTGWTMNSMNQLDLSQLHPVAVQ